MASVSVFMDILLVGWFSMLTAWVFRNRYRRVECEIEIASRLRSHAGKAEMQSSRLEEIEGRVGDIPAHHAAFNREEVLLRFSTHDSPSPDQKSRMTIVRSRFSALAIMLTAQVPPSPELAGALDCLETASMLANAGIARRMVPRDQIKELGQIPRDKWCEQIKELKRAKSPLIREKRFETHFTGALSSVFDKQLADSEAERAAEFPLADHYERAIEDVIDST